jgi:hypothetical protein
MKPLRLKKVALAEGRIAEPESLNVLPPIHGVGFKVPAFGLIEDGERYYKLAIHILGSSIRLCGSFSAHERTASLAGNS